MSDLVKSVTEGVVEQTKTAAAESKGTSALGKDAFLQLLVTQMKYQDPLNPNTDTEFIAQLATFSQLEQMQNIGTLTTNSQAFSLVGKEVIVKTVSPTGNTTYVSGRVDFVNMSGGKAQMSIEGKLYPVDQLDSVIDDIYIFEKGLPKVEKTELKYDAENSKDMSFTVFMGDGRTKATDVAILVEDILIDASKVEVKGNKITIDKSVFEEAVNGTYNITVVFNDSQMTAINDMVTLQVINSTHTVEEQEAAEEGDTEDDQTEDGNNP